MARQSEATAKLSAAVQSVPAAPTDEVRTGPRSRKGMQTRARLLDAAKVVFERDGFLDARIADIAETAQLAIGSFYHYFDSKEQIFREIAQLQEARLTAPDAAPRNCRNPTRRGSGSAGPTADTWSVTATRRR